MSVEDGVKKIIARSDSEIWRDKINEFNEGLEAVKEQYDDKFTKAARDEAITEYKQNKLKEIYEELEDPETYDVYLSKYSKSESEKFEEDEEDNDNSYDEEELKEDIRSELNDRATIEEVNYYNDSLGKNAVIVIKGKENLSDKITSNGMRSAVANVVKGVKNSDIDLDDFTVDVDYPVTTKGDSTSDEHVIKSKWSMNTVNSLSEKQLELLNENLNEYADSYYESSALK